GGRRCGRWRSRAACRCIPQFPRWPWSGLRTSAGARSFPPSSSGVAWSSPRSSINSAAPRGSPISSGRGATSSSRRYRNRPSASSCAASSWRGSTSSNARRRFPAKTHPGLDRAPSIMPIEERGLIAGAGPGGLAAAAHPVRRGLPGAVVQARPGLREGAPAATFHPPPLDMLDRLDAARPLIAQGLTAPAFQYRSRRRGVLAQFDFGAIGDVTGHPYRVQCEQSKLTRIFYQQLRDKPDFELQFDAQVKDVTQHRSGVEIAIDRNGRSEPRSGRWLIGADGARSDVRRALGIEFPGFTWPERFLVVSTPFDFRAVIPDLVAVSYVSDPERWHFLLQIPGLCRVMFPIAPHESDELALSGEFAQSLMSTVVPGISNYEIAHATLYKVHQRVAETFQRGRAFLAGDAAHINNPLGGMGMNGGIHDAINLTSRLVEAWHGRQPEGDLARYDRQRRAVTREYIERQSIQNKRNLESDGTEFGRNLAEIAADKTRTYDYLLRVAMIASLRRAQELG